MLLHLMFMPSNFIIVYPQLFTESGDTPLHTAAEYDKVCILSYCLEQKRYLIDSRGISRDLPLNNAGQTPLDVAAQKGSVNCAQYIVSKLVAKAEMRSWEKVQCEYKCHCALSDNCISYFVTELVHQYFPQG